MALHGFWRKYQAGGQYGSIGIELGLEQFNLVQLRRANNTSAGSPDLEVAAFASSPVTGDLHQLLESGQELVQALRQALQSAKFQGKRATVAMPSSLVRVMPLTYQLAPGQSEGQAILALMQEHIGESFSDFVLDYMPVANQKKERQQLALVAMCRRETVLTFLGLIRKAGLVVEALEIGPIAIQRLVTELQQNRAANNVLVVNCGQERSYLTLIAGGRLLSDEEVSFGGNSVIERVSRILDMPQDIVHNTLRQTSLNPKKWREPAEREMGATLIEIIKPAISDLVQEIQRALLFANSESQANVDNEVYLLGSFARWHGSETLLADMLGAPVRKVPNPFANFAHAPQTGGMPELAVATGLALKEFQVAAEAEDSDEAQATNAGAAA